MEFKKGAMVPLNGIMADCGGSNHNENCSLLDFALTRTGVIDR